MLKWILEEVDKSFTSVGRTLYDFISGDNHQPTNQIFKDELNSTTFFSINIQTKVC